MSTVLIAFSAGSAVEHVDLPVVRAFHDRGHRVLFLGEASTRAGVEALGATFVPLPASKAPAAVRASRVLPGVQQVDSHLRRRFLQPLAAQWAAVQELLTTERIDAIVTDPLFLGATLLCLLPAAERPPIVVLGTIPLPHSSPDIAPFGLGLLPLQSRLNRPRNLLLQHLIDDVLLRRVGRDLRVAARALTGRDLVGGLQAGPKIVDVWAQLSVTRFEYPRARFPENVRFIGPLRPVSTGSLPDWWYEQDDRPLVHIAHDPASDPRDLTLPAIEALADSDVQVVVTAGVDVPRIDTMLRGRRPANLRLEPAVPFAHLLPRCAVMITHGSYAVVHQALRWGIPVIVGGTAEDKVEVNARVEWAGVGVNLRTARPDAQAIRDAVVHVLEDPAIRAATSRIAVQVASTDAQATLCDLAEDLIDARGQEERLSA